MPILPTTSEKPFRGAAIAATLILIATIGIAVGTVYTVIQDTERSANEMREQVQLARDGERAAKESAEKAVENEHSATKSSSREKAARRVVETTAAGEKSARAGEQKAKADLVSQKYACRRSCLPRTSCEPQRPRARTPGVLPAATPRLGMATHRSALPCGGRHARRPQGCRTLGIVLARRPTCGDCFSGRCTGLGCQNRPASCDARSPWNSSDCGVLIGRSISPDKGR